MDENNSPQGGLNKKLPEDLKTGEKEIICTKLTGGIKWKKLVAQGTEHF